MHVRCKTHFLASILAALLCAPTLSGCVPVTYVIVQNQLAETVVLTCWEGDPEHVLWSVRIPARTTVKAELRGNRIRPSKDGFTRIGLGNNCGFSYRGEDSQHEISKPDLLKSFRGPSWWATHTVCPRSGGRKRVTELIITENDIVVVMIPRKTLKVELEKIPEGKNTD